MRIPETPDYLADLDLMKKLDRYAKGEETWHSDGTALGKASRDACASLYTNLSNLINQVFSPILNRANDRQMETFTMHDAKHGLKVAHLMWHILVEPRKHRLTPAEIGLLVAAAFFHDLGMALSPDERKQRLLPESDLWERVEIMGWTHLSALEKDALDPKLSEAKRKGVLQRLQQAEEALLCVDTRERHGERERYWELVESLRSMARGDDRIPYIDACLMYDQDPLLEKLVDICVSHNEDATHLSDMDPFNVGRDRFLQEYPVGDCTANLLMVAASLRISDILDFDRERTPVALYHYLLPVSLGVLENRSNLEWCKHMAITSWDIEEDGVVYRGKCDDHVVHHAIVEFCREIQEEIEKTRRVMVENICTWPFVVQPRVTSDITEQGYRYAPYRFQLDDDRVYHLLMGRAIYDEPLQALRELVQNSVDACLLRDNLDRLHEPYFTPSRTGRIIITYEEPSAACPLPRLTVQDSGTGMDRNIIEKWFLRVGSSYYRSPEFIRERVTLRKAGLDFAPVSEFGVGFLSSFMLADRVVVETARWESNDTVRRTLVIDGPTRLLKVMENAQSGAGRFKGTRITLFLSKGGDQDEVPTWGEVQEYLSSVCQELPYVLQVNHVDGKGKTDETNTIEPVSRECMASHDIEPFCIRIPYEDKHIGVEGQLLTYDEIKYDESQRGTARVRPDLPFERTLLRGGFFVSVPFQNHNGLGCRLRLTWESTKDHRYLTPSLSRNSIPDEHSILQSCVKAILKFVVNNREKVPRGRLSSLWVPSSMWDDTSWLKEYSHLTWYRAFRPEWEVEVEGGEAVLDQWEEGEGSPVPEPDAASTTMQLLRQLLSRITKRVLVSGGRVVLPPPRKDWRTIFAEHSDFAVGNHNYAWAEFAEEVGHLGIYLSPSNTTLNSAYSETLNVMSHKEMSYLRGALFTVGRVRHFSYAQSLTLDEATAFKKAQNLLPDVLVGTEKDSVPFSELKIEG